MGWPARSGLRSVNDNATYLGGRDLRSRPSDRRDELGLPVHLVYAVVDATRAIGALIAESLAGAESSVTVPQWRVLVLAAEGSVNLTAVAEDLGVHPSNATRVCDRLVKAGLVNRQRDGNDRRHVRLTLTPAGEELYASAMRYRRERVEAAMARISSEHRYALAAALVEFAAALDAVHLESRGEPAEDIRGDR